jgi:hypothetical protein
MPTQARYLLQIPAVLLILAFVPTNLGKLAAFMVVWVLTFRRLNRTEAIFYVLVCIFFTCMNAASLKQGIFAFTEPDFLLQPIYELAMWGFYLLHTRRLLNGPAPEGRRATVWALALAFAAAFGVIKDANVLLAVTATVLVIGLALFHEREDLLYTGYLIVLGALIEYTGVHSGNWSYPGNPPGGVPLWFITMWGGIGLFLRRLVVPILVHHETRTAQARAAQA